MLEGVFAIFQNFSHVYTQCRDRTCTSNLINVSFKACIPLRLKTESELIDPLDCQM